MNQSYESGDGSHSMDCMYLYMYIGTGMYGTDPTRKLSTNIKEGKEGPNHTVPVHVSRLSTSLAKRDNRKIEIHSVCNLQLSPNSLSTLKIEEQYECDG